MVPGGITESIWHFSGYLRIFDDIARDREVLDEGGYRPQIDDYTAKLSNFLVPSVDDEFTANPVHMPDGDFLQGIRGSRIGPLRHPHDQDHHPDPQKPFAPPPVTPLIPANEGSGGGGGDIVIQVAYQPGGEQSLLEVHQINHLDNDTTLELGPSPQLAAMLAWETGNTLEQMEAKADTAIPDRWIVPQDSMQITQFVDGHDQREAALGGAQDPHSVTPGFYTDGMLQDPSLTPPDQLPVPQMAAAPDVTHGQGLGQWTYDGGNGATNLAQIVDMTDSARTMIVLGNSYTSDAIVQTNSFVNHDNIAVSDPYAVVSTGGNLATNMADFVEHPGVYASLPAYWAGPNWDVEIVNGNYYNVHTLEQINYLSNNNITVQESADSQYVAQGGGNQLENLAKISDGGFNYDLVIVGGSFHNLNAIFQNNILLNNDIIKMSGNGADPIQTVTAGNNQLTNMATIDNYGGNGTQPYTPDLANLVSEIKAGITQLDPAFGQLVAGDGGTFHVLYVTGDYYDVNAVWQTNIVANSNIIMQLLNPPAAAVAAFYGGGAETQSVTTGQNVLTNDAAIIHVGATTTDLNGQAYTDTILIQANLVTQQSDHVTVANPQALVPEIIAFIGSADVPAPATTHTATPTTMPIHADPLASLTH